MSRTDLPLYLAPQAEEDFADILQYTLETWGKAQAIAYRAVLDKALLMLKKNPYLGQLRTELTATHRNLAAGQHIIVYRSTD